MRHYIGIGKFKCDVWYTITIFMFNRLVKQYLYTLIPKRPKYYYYDKECYTEAIEDDNIKWFFGFTINIKQDN